MEMEMEVRSTASLTVSRLKRWLPVVFVVLMAVASLVTIYGDLEVKKGVDHMEQDVHQLKLVLDGFTLEGDELSEDIDRLESLVPPTTGPGSCEEAEPIDKLKGDIQSYGQSLDEYTGLFDKLPGHVDYIRTKLRENKHVFVAAMTSPLLLVLLCSVLGLPMTIWWVRRGARAVAFLATVGFLALGLVVSLELGLSVAVADFCMDPDQHAIDNAPEGPAKEIVTYYAFCGQYPNPLADKLIQARDGLAEVTQVVAELSCPLCPCPDSTSPGWPAFRVAISEASDSVEELLDASECGRIHPLWASILHQATCSQVVSGLAFCWVTGIVCGVVVVVWTILDAKAWHATLLPEDHIRYSAAAAAPAQVPLRLSNDRASREATSRQQQQADESVLPQPPLEAPSQESQRKPLLG